MTQAPPPPSPLPAHAPRLAGLDTLRAIAILLVFMSHYTSFVSRAPTFGFLGPIGWIGVDLFFVLSGYLIANQLLAGVVRGRQLSLKGFYVRRFLRTLPNFYVVLALYFLFPAFMGGRQPPDLWRFLTFTQNYQLQPGTAFSHAWSLCVEEQFYLLLPAVVLLAARFGRSVRLAWVALVALILAGMALRGVLWTQHALEAGDAVNGYYPNIYYSSFCRFDEFLPGVAVALLKNLHPATWQRLLAHGRAVMWAGLAACALLGWANVSSYYIDGYGYGFFMTTFGYSLNAIAFALLVVAALSPQTALARWRIPGAASLALWSYALYLSHKPIVMILARHMPGWGIDNPSILALAIAAGACLLAGWLMFTLVEMPFMRLRDRISPSSFKTGAATAAPMQQQLA